jgi:hypothetical protein
MDIIGADAISLERLLLSGHFAPAAVQRDFRWGKGECRALLDDFSRAFAEAGLDPTALVDDEEFAEEHSRGAQTRLPDYFLGAIVLSENAPGRYSIFDGQQRITSCTVLLAVLRDRSAASDLKERLHACVHDANERGRLSLDLRDHTLSYDVQRLSATQTFWSNEDRDGVSDAGLRLRASVQVFRSEIDGWDTRKVEAFAKFLLDKVTVVRVRVQDERLANLAFETTNFRGLRLDQADALKSQIIDAIGTSDGQQETAGAEWLDLQREFGVHEFERFLTAVDFLERRQWQGPTKFADLFAHLREKHGPKLSDWVHNDLHKYAEAYRPLRAHETVVAARGADLHLRRLSLLPWREWVAVAMKQRMTLATKDLEEALAKLEGASFAILFAQYSSHDRAKIFRNALRQRDPFARGALTFNSNALRKIDDFLTGPIDEDDKELMHATVRWLEALHWGRELPLPPIDPALTVEHVLPLRPSALWTNDFPERNERERLSRLTGNLCLLPKVDNQLWAGNRTYSDKRAVLRGASRTLHVPRSIAQNDRWTATVIQRRTGELRDLAWRAMNLPSISQ